MSIEGDVEQRARDRVGTTVKGKYELDGLLGLGGMGAVYAATHKNNRGRVAVKVLHPELAIDAHIKQRFLREGYVANTVAHPGAVRIIDDDTGEDGAPFLVMELLSGETLESRLDRTGGRAPASEIAPVAAKLLDVLAAAHQKGIVHRDIKPENVFITTDGIVKVLDFGIARLRDGGGTNTRTGQTLGTPAFMAPEQAIGNTEEISAATDVWAVGATIFTAITGRYVHEARFENEMMVHAATKTAPSLAAVAPETPAALVTIVDRALAFDSKARYASAAEMRDALVAAFSLELEQVLPQPTIPIAASSPSQKEAFATTVASRDEGTSSIAGVTSGSHVVPATPLLRRTSVRVALGAGVVLIAGATIVAMTSSTPPNPGASVAPTASPAIVTTPSTPASNGPPTTLAPIASTMPSASVVATSVASHAPAVRPKPSATAKPSATVDPMDHQ